jgi:hypothetical protein
MSYYSYNVFNTFQPPRSTVTRGTSQEDVYPDGELGHGSKVAAGPCVTILIPTAAQVPQVTAARVPQVTAARAPQITAAQFPPAIAAHADLENDSEMWNMYLDEVKEEDSRITEAWKDDANSIVTFVSHNLLARCVHLRDKLQDRSFLRNCWRIHP